KTRVLRLQQQAAYTRAMHLDAEIVDTRIGDRERAENLAGAEADLEAARRCAAEDRLEIERGAAELQSIPRPQLAQRAVLGGGDASGAQYEAADGPMGQH